MAIVGHATACVDMRVRGWSMIPEIHHLMHLFANVCQVLPPARYNDALTGCSLLSGVSSGVFSIMDNEPLQILSISSRVWAPGDSKPASHDSSAKRVSSSPHLSIRQTLCKNLSSFNCADFGSENPTGSTLALSAY